MTIYIWRYLYCQVDERVWIESRSGHGIRLSARTISFPSRRGKEGGCATQSVTCAVKRRDRTILELSLFDERRWGRINLHRRLVLDSASILQFFNFRRTSTSFFSSCSYKEVSTEFLFFLKKSISPALVRFPPVAESFIDRLQSLIDNGDLTMIIIFFFLFSPQVEVPFSSVHFSPLLVSMHLDARRWKLKYSSFFYVVKLFRNIRCWRIS